MICIAQYNTSLHGDNDLYYPIQYTAPARSNGTGRSNVGSGDVSKAKNQQVWICVLANHHYYRFTSVSMLAWVFTNFIVTLLNQLSIPFLLFHPSIFTVLQHLPTLYCFSALLTTPTTLTSLVSTTTYFFTIFHQPLPSNHHSFPIKLEELKRNIAVIEAERDFYFSKLRQIEVGGWGW